MSDTTQGMANTPQASQWPLREVFVQPPGGEPHEHAGSVHAVDAESALQNARDVYARRGEAVSIWVVRSGQITACQTGGSRDRDPGGGAGRDETGLRARRARNQPIRHVHEFGQIDKVLPGLDHRRCGLVGDDRRAQSGHLARCIDDLP